MVSLCRRVAWAAGLDFMGRRILREKTLVAKMVSCELAGYIPLLCSCACSGHSLTSDNLGFCVSYAQLYNSHFHLLARRSPTHEHE